MSCHGGGEHHSHEGARKFFSLLAQHTTATPEPVAFIPAGHKHVAVYGKLKGKANATGKEIELDVAHLWQVENGKINRFEAFIDTPAILTALSN